MEAIGTGGIPAFFCMRDNLIPVFLIVLAVVTHYLDLGLGVPKENSISIGLLTAGTTLLNLNFGGKNDGGN